MLIGIMQGRLGPPENDFIQAFPREGWEAEFSAAQAAGLDFIEWIYDSYGEDVNPLVSTDGSKHVTELKREFSVEVLSLCADYFMEHPLIRAPAAEKQELLERFEWMLRQAHELGVKWVVLPFVDNSEISSASEIAEVSELACRLERTLKLLGMELHLETSLAPAELGRLLEMVPEESVKANYDSGNSTANGFDVLEEFEAYGQSIGSIHIKDRVRGGGTVALGTGETEFDKLFQEMKRVEYNRALTLQVARDQSGDEVEWAKHNLSFVKKYLENSQA